MSRKTKISPEEKVRIIRKYMDGGVSLRGAADEVGVGKGTLRQWILQYTTEGVSTFLPNKRNHIYSPELKLQAVREYLSGGGSLREISKKYGLRDKKQAVHQ